MTQNDSRSRVSAIHLLSAIWEACNQRARDSHVSHKEDEETLQLFPLRSIATSLINATVSTVLLDSVGKVRRASLHLLQIIAPQLKTNEVLKVALVKVRDRDKATRKLAFRILSEIVERSNENRIDAETGGKISLSSPDLPEMLLTTDAVSVLVHQAFAQEGTLEMCQLAESVFWSFVVSHVPDPSAAVALRELQVIDRLNVYEPLLRSKVNELYGAQFDEEEVLLVDDYRQVPLNAQPSDLQGDFAGEVG